MTYSAIYRALMLTKVLVILGMMLALLPDARAGDFLISPGGISWHADRSKNFNEVNNGFAGTWRDGDVIAYSAGFYGNSIHRRAYFVSARWTPVQVGPVRAGVLAGAVTGYAANSGGAMPFALPAVATELGPVEVALIGWPAMFGSGAGIAAHFSVRVW